MKVLLLGSGAREHALARSLAADPDVEELHALPFPVPPGWVRDLDGSASTPTAFEHVYLGHFSTVRGETS